MWQRLTIMFLGAVTAAGCVTVNPPPPASQLPTTAPRTGTQNQAVAALPFPVSLPPGFAIAYYAPSVPGARSLTLAPEGIVFVGSRDEGRVYALVPDPQNPATATVTTIASGLNSPNGVAFKDGTLYVAEISRITAYPDILNRLSDPPTPVVVTTDLPSNAQHGWKFLAFGPDGYLYVPVGAPCNACRVTDPHAALLRIRPDGTGREIIARGIRNTVGFDWHPGTGALWFTDNGRDNLGDNRPPDELNRVGTVGDNFGYPVCLGDGTPDPQLGGGADCSAYRAPAVALDPHVAALGMRFYTGTQFPEEYRRQIIIAEHGSWNSSRRVGYRLTTVDVTGNQAGNYRVFAAGWVDARENVFGRPVDVLVMPDGALLVSDDYAGAVYRITYQ